MPCASPWIGSFRPAFASTAHHPAGLDFVLRRAGAPERKDMTAMDQFRYDGKRVLVVGGATGMGAAAAKIVGEVL